MTSEYIKFADQLKEDILARNKYLTVRYDWPDNRIEAGDTVALVGSSEEEFAQATITCVTTMTIQQFVDAGFEGHQKYHSSRHMCENMQQFYPDANLTPHTAVTVVLFNVR